MITRPREWSARSLALHLLLQVRRKEAFVQELLEESFREVSLSPPDRRLTTQLVCGVLRRRAALDALLRGVVTRSYNDVEPWLWEALRLGAFQLAYLSRMPAYSILHETVELAVAFDQPRAKGFLNANLRSLTRLLTDDFLIAPSGAALPLEPGKYRRLAKSVMPDPKTVPVQYLSTAFSLPIWLAERWVKRWNADETARLGFWFAEPGPLWLRVNPLRTTRADFLAKLEQADCQARPGEHPQAVMLDDGASIRELPGFAEGHFVVQDPSAMKVASALDPQPGWRVLDLCAAPGGKSTHLAELMRDEGRVTSCDRDAARLQPLRDTMERLGLRSITPTPITTIPPAGPFDAALVDVPCSNTGVLGKRPEVRWRLSEGELRRLIPQQSRLLAQACERVVPGGIVVYSTCSIEPEENVKVVQGVLAGLPEWRLEAEETSMPGMPSDGGYWARLRRRA